MQKKQSSWIIPSLGVAYLGLASFRQATGAMQVVVLLLPLLCSFALRYLETQGTAERRLRGSRIMVMGGSLYAITLIGPQDSDFYRLLSCLGLGLLTLAPLRALIDLPYRSSLLPERKKASSQDAYFIASLLWGAVCSTFLLRSLFSNLSFFDPRALQLAQLFATIGSLLLILFSLFRAFILRRYELGATERIQAGLLLFACAFLVALVGGLSQQFTPQPLIGSILLVSALLSTYFIEQEKTDRLEQHFRSSTLILIVLVPAAIAYSLALVSFPHIRLSLGLSAIPIFFLIGGLYTPLSRLLARNHARWELAFENALNALSGVASEEALRLTLVALTRLEVAQKLSPSIWLSASDTSYTLNRAEYLEVQVSPFPRILSKYCQSEPFGVLRIECIHEALMRKPELKLVMAWFEANEARSAIALRDSDNELIGLLILPAFKSSRALSLHQVIQLQTLGQRLGALIEMLLKVKELIAKIALKTDHIESEQMGSCAHQHLLAENQNAQLAEKLTRSSFSPNARLALSAVNAHDPAHCLHLRAEAGIHLEAWTAKAMLEHAPRRQLFSLNFLESGSLNAFEELQGLPITPTQAFAFYHPPEEIHDTLCSYIEEIQKIGGFVIVIESEKAPALSKKHGALTKLLGRGSTVLLPPLRERPEDLQAMVIAELADLSTKTQSPHLSISSEALRQLIEYPFYGNDAELNSMLNLASHLSKFGVIGLEHLQQLLDKSLMNTHNPTASAEQKSEFEDFPVIKRTRGKRASSRRSSE